MRNDILYFSRRSRTIPGASVIGFVESSISGFNLDVVPRQPTRAETFGPSERVWLVALQDGGRGRRIDELLRKEMRCVSAMTGESLVRPEDDILVYDPSSNEFVYARSGIRQPLPVDLGRAATTIFAGSVVGKSVEMLFVDFRGGTPASRPERGASPIRKVVDRVANPRNPFETAHLCSRGLSLFSDLDGSIEGILCQGLADALLKQKGDPLDALAYLRRARIAFGRASLAVPGNAADEAYRRLDGLAVRWAQPELPLELPREETKSPPFVPARLGFSSHHAVGFAVETGSPRLPGRALGGGRRSILGRIHAAALFEGDFLRRLKHATMRPSIEVMDRRRIVGRPVRIRTVLDGEFPTLLGVAGEFTGPGRFALVRITAENAEVESAILRGRIGVPLQFCVVPREPGPVNVKISFLANGNAHTATNISFLARQDSERNG